MILSGLHPRVIMSFILTPAWILITLITKLKSVSLNYFSISKHERGSRWSLEMDKLFHPTLYPAYD